MECVRLTESRVSGNEVGTRLYLGVWWVTVRMESQRRNAVSLLGVALHPRSYWLYIELREEEKRWARRRRAERRGEKRGEYGSRNGPNYSPADRRQSLRENVHGFDICTVQDIRILFL